MDIIERIKQEEIDKIAVVLCISRNVLEELADRMEDEECLTLLECQCNQFDKDEVQDIANMISQIEDWFFINSSDNKPF